MNNRERQTLAHAEYRRMISIVDELMKIQEALKTQLTTVTASLQVARVREAEQREELIRINSLCE